jgi:hypothetical protein
MMLFVTANDLLTMFVALEVFSLPLYLLCAMARRRRLVSQEAALKYFLLGAYASAFFVFGMALLYGFAGSVRFSAISEAVLAATGSRLLLFSGLALVAVGLLFKVAAVPFHVWTPTSARRTDPVHMRSRLRSRRIRQCSGCLRLRPGRVGHQAVLGVIAVWRCRRRGSRRRPCQALSRTRRSPTPAASSIGVPVQRNGLALDVLPGRVRVRGDRGVRSGDAGARRGRRGDAPVALGRPR